MDGLDDPTAGERGGAGPTGGDAAVSPWLLADELTRLLADTDVARAAGEGPIALAVTTPDGDALGWNREAARMLGLTPDRLGRRLSPRADVDLLVEAARRGPVSYSCMFPTPDGRELAITVTAWPVHDGAGEVVALLCNAYDRTAEMRAIQDVRRRERQQAALFELGRVGALDASLASLVDVAATAACSGIDADGAFVLLADGDGHLRRTTGCGDVTGVDDDAVGALARQLATASAPGGDDVTSFEADVGGRPVVGCAMTGPTGVGLAVGVIRSGRVGASDAGFLRSLTSLLVTSIDRRRLATELRRRALYDDLTELPNRGYVMELIDKAAARDTGVRAGVLFFDLDEFKQINDRLGHAAGDAVLIEVAHRLRSTSRSTDHVARLSGDEFVVLCDPVQTDDDLLGLAERYLVAVSEPIDLAGRRVRTGASCGAAVLAPGMDAEEAVRCADFAMYAAKRRGGGSAQLFTPALRDARIRELQLEAALRDRAAAGRFDLWFEPRVLLAHDEVVAVQARITPADFGPDTSRQFLAIADQLGTATQLIQAALPAIADALAEVRADRPGLRVVVELPAAALAEPAVADAVRTLGPRIVPLALEVIDAGAFGTDVAAVHPALRALGVQFGIADLGLTSSLGGLDDPWADTVTVGSEIVAQLGTNRVATAIADAAVHLGRRLRLEVNADGVETPEQRARLAARGCHAGQGPLWTPPLPAPELARWIRTCGT